MRGCANGVDVFSSPGRQDPPRRGPRRRCRGPVPRGRRRSQQREPEDDGRSSSARARLRPSPSDRRPSASTTPPPVLGIRESRRSRSSATSSSPRRGRLRLLPARFPRRAHPSLLPKKTRPGSGVTRSSARQRSGRTGRARRGRVRARKRSSSRHHRRARAPPLASARRSMRGAATPRASPSTQHAQEPPSGRSSRPRALRLPAKSRPVPRRQRPASSSGWLGAANYGVIVANNRRSGDPVESFHVTGSVRPDRRRHRRHAHQPRFRATLLDAGATVRAVYLQDSMPRAAPTPPSGRGSRSASSTSRIRCGRAFWGDRSALQPASRSSSTTPASAATRSSA